MGRRLHRGAEGKARRALPRVPEEAGGQVHRVRHRESQAIGAHRAARGLPEASRPRRRGLRRTDPSSGTGTLMPLRILLSFPRLSSCLPMKELLTHAEENIIKNQK